METGCLAGMSHARGWAQGLFDMTGVMGGAVSWVVRWKKSSIDENGTLQSFRHLERAVRRVVQREVSRRWKQTVRLCLAGISHARAWLKGLFDMTGVMNGAVS